MVTVLEPAHGMEAVAFTLKLNEGAMYVSVALFLQEHKIIMGTNVNQRIIYIVYQLSLS